MKRIITFLVLAMIAGACGNKNGKATVAADKENASENAASTANPSYDPNRGEGKFKEVSIPEKLDPKLADQGMAIYNVKCSSCHKTTEEKLVGPGWKGVTTRHSAPWIMNFITNPDPMIDKDPEVQAQLELCLVRMPNQNLAENEAREIVEFMRQNDGAK